MPDFKGLVSLILSFFAAFGSSSPPSTPAPYLVEPTIFTSPTLTPTPTLIPTPIPTLKPTPIPVPTKPIISGPPGTGLSTVTVGTAKGNFKVTVLSLDLSTTRVITDTASDSDCPTSCPVTSLAAFVAKNGGFAGVNGTYFCPATYPDCASKTNSFDFPVYNSRLNKWINGGNLGWGGRSIIYTDGSGAHYHQNSAGFGGGLNAGVINYPGLLDGSSVQIDDSQSGLSDKQKARNTKIGLATRSPNNLMVIVAYGVNMQEFAYVAKALGAVSALNLDTGGSGALYYNGRYAIGPGREIPNAVIFARK